MISVDQIRLKIADYLDDRIQIGELEDWILANAWNVHRFANQQTVNLVHWIEGRILDFDAGAISLSTLRSEMTEAAETIRPFAFAERLYAKPIELVVGKPSSSQKTAAFNSLVLRPPAVSV
jgi:hypothetical protein